MAKITLNSTLKYFKIAKSNVFNVTIRPYSKKVCNAMNREDSKSLFLALHSITIYCTRPCPANVNKPREERVIWNPSKRGAYQYWWTVCLVIWFCQCVCKVFVLWVYDKVDSWCSKVLCRVVIYHEQSQEDRVNKLKNWNMVWLSHLTKDGAEWHCKCPSYHGARLLKHTKKKHPAESDILIHMGLLCCLSK